MRVCYAANEKKKWEELPSEKYSEKTRGSVKNSHSIWDNAKNRRKRDDKDEEKSTESDNVYVMDISICTHFEEATDGYIIESYESLSSTDEKKYVQEPSVEETSGGVKKCLFLTNEMNKDQSTVYDNKMNPKRYKSEQEPPSQQRNLNLSRQEQSVFPGYSNSGGDAGQKLSNVNRDSVRLGSDNKMSLSRTYKRADSREHAFKAPEVCGVASLRMQRLRKQLEDARHLRERLSASDSFTGKKTLPPVKESTTYPGYSGTARSRLTGQDKPYSLSAPPPHPQGGRSTLGSGIHRPDHRSDALLHPSVRNDQPVPVSASSASGAHMATRSAVRSENRLVESVHPGRDYRSYSMFSNPYSSVSPVKRSELYSSDCPVGYKKPGDGPSKLMEAHVVSETDTTWKGVVTTCEERTRKHPLTSGLSRVTVEASRRPLELPKGTSSGLLYTRRKDIRTDQPRSIQVTGRPNEQLSLNPHDDLDKDSQSYSSSTRVYTEVKTSDKWKTTSESSGSVPKKDLYLSKSQESQALVPVNQWGRPHKSVSYNDPAYYVDQYRGKSYYVKGEDDYYYKCLNYYLSFFKNQRLSNMRKFNSYSYGRPYSYQDYPVTSYIPGKENPFPRESYLPPYQIKNNQVNNFSQIVRRSPAYRGNLHQNVQLPRRICYNDQNRWNRFEPSIHARFRKNYPNWIQHNTGPLRFNIYGQQEGKGTVAEFLKPLGRPRSIHRSKGGISKVSTRVQKQVRSAAPLLKAICRRSSNPEKIETTDSSVAKSKNEPVSVPVTVSETQVIPSKIIGEESMDWEPIEPEQVVKHVGELRKQSSFQTSASCNLANLCNPNVLPSKWFIIVDTNIFLSHLSFVETLRDTNDPTLGMPTLLVPWVVLNELDCLKGSSTKEKLKYPAIRAINFVWRSLVSKHPRLEGQHPSECDKSMDVKADDSILHCCMKMKEKSEKVALLTNDHNLQSRALVSGIECFSAKELQRKIAKHELVTLSSEGVNSEDKGKKEINSFLSQLKDCMKLILGEVLLGEMLDAYGPMWKSIIARKPPLSLTDILFCLLKHWLAVFGIVLPPACKELFKKLEEKFAEEQAGSSWYNLEILIKVCCEVIEHLQLQRYDEKINEGVRTLNELRTICDKKINASSGSQSPISTAAVSAGMPPSTSQTGFPECEEESGSFRSNKSNVSCGSGDDHAHSDAKSMGESFDDYLSLHASSLSDGASDISSADLEMDKGQRIVQYYLDEIFKKVSTFCGLLCEMMGLVPSVAFDRPECLPTIEALQQNMPLVFPCVHNLLLNIQRVFSVRVQDLSVDHPVIVQLYHTIKDSCPMNQSSVGPVLPLHILAYCTDDNTRQSLERGAHQFEQFEAIFNKAVLFFMGQNRPAPLPSF